MIGTGASFSAVFVPGRAGWAFLRSTLSSEAQALLTRAARRTRALRRSTLLLSIGEKLVDLVAVEVARLGMALPGRTVAALEEAHGVRRDDASAHADRNIADVAVTTPERTTRYVFSTL